MDSIGSPSRRIRGTIYKKSLLFLLIVYYLLFISTPLGVLAHGEVEHGELIIRMTKQGFEPSEITVTEGDHVTFINADTIDRWPASNLHPTHGIYPEFDPLKGIHPGDSWEMIFAKAGTWRMHDHLIPSMTGVITVLKNIKAPETGIQTTSAEGEEIKSKKQGFFTRIKAALIIFFQKLGNISS